MSNPKQIIPGKHKFPKGFIVTGPETGIYNGIEYIWVGLNVEKKLKGWVQKNEENREEFRSKRKGADKEL